MCESGTFLRDPAYIKSKAALHLKLRTTPRAETAWRDTPAPFLLLFLLFGAPVADLYNQGKGLVDILCVLKGASTKRLNIIDVDGKLSRLIFTLLLVHLLEKLQA